MKPFIIDTDHRARVNHRITNKVFANYCVILCGRVMGKRKRIRAERPTISPCSYEFQIH